MNELDFRLLSVLNETHNVTKAADRLFLTQSAVSRRIAALEAELGTVLFTRTKQGISFTPDGESVFQSTCRAAGELEQMRETLMLQKGVICGTLRVGVTNNYAATEFAPIVAAFRARYPHVRINILTDHSRRISGNLAAGTIDVGIVRGEQDWSDGRLLMKSEPICAIRCRRDAEKSLQELPYIERLTSQQLSRSISKWLRENDLPRLLSNIASEHIINCVQMVSEGLGWAIVPEMALHGFDGCVTPLIYQDGTPLNHNTWLLYAETNLSLPAVEAFVRLLYEFNGQDPACLTF